MILARVLIFASKPLSTVALPMTTEDARNILRNMHIYFKCKHSLGCKATLLLSSKNHPACFFPAAWLKTWGYLALSSELISGCPEPGSCLGARASTAGALLPSPRGRGTGSADLACPIILPCLQPYEGALCLPL